MNPTPDEASSPAERPGTPKDKKFSEFLKTWITTLDDDREAYDSSHDPNKNIQPPTSLPQ